VWGLAVRREDYSPSAVVFPRALWFCSWAAGRGGFAQLIASRRGIATGDEVDGRKQPPLRPRLWRSSRLRGREQCVAMVGSRARSDSGEGVPERVRWGPEIDGTRFFLGLVPMHWTMVASAPDGARTPTVPPGVYRPRGRGPGRPPPRRRYLQTFSNPHPTRACGAPPRPHRGRGSHGDTR